MNGFLRVAVVLACGGMLAACVSDLGVKRPTLHDQLAGNPVVFDPPEGLPATRSTYHPDGTLTAFFRPLLLPDRLSEKSGYWWIENGRFCSSGHPRAETEVASCHTVTISGDRIRFTPWNPPRLIEIFPDLRSERQGTIIRNAGT